jgi:hypothetical protein
VTDREHKALDALIGDVELSFKQRFPDINKSIHEWTKKEISLWQNDLQDIVGSRLSERWFYDHIKNKERVKLPRIDALNLLSKYAGKLDFNEYLKAQSIEIDNKRKKTKIVYAGIILMFIALTFSLLGRNSQYEYHLNLIQDDLNIPVQFSEKGIVEVYDNELKSKTSILLDSSTISFKSSHNEVILVTKIPHYKIDTLKLRYSGDSKDVALDSDDYATLIQIISNQNQEDWNTRKMQLERMIAKDAMIFQVSETGTAIDLLTRTDFINKLTLPTRSLKNIQILHTVYENDKILRMKFKK